MSIIPYFSFILKSLFLQGTNIKIKNKSEDNENDMSKGRLNKYAVKAPLIVIGVIKENMYHVFNKKLLNSAAKTLKIYIGRFFLKKPKSLKTPAKYPVIPQAYICHGVQTPCPKNILDISALNAPTKKPLSREKQMPAKIAIAKTGLKFGIAANIIRPATLRAVKHTIGIKSLTRTLLTSKHAKKDIIAVNTTKRLSKDVFATLNIAKSVSTIGTDIMVTVFNMFRSLYIV